MMIGTFDLWFGNANGSALRAWCIERGWPLAWAHNPLDSLWRCGVNTSTGGDCTPPVYTFAHGVAPSNIRFLDPEVLRHVSAGHNISGLSGFDAAETAFQATWLEVSKLVLPTSSPKQRRAVLDPIWQQLAASSDVLPLAVEPPWAGACADECAGVRIVDGTCVCDGAAPTESVSASAATAAAVSDAGAPVPLAERLRAALQPILDERATRHDAGFTLAFVNANTTVELVSGNMRRTNDAKRSPTSPMTPSDPLLWGSITKMYTAASVMRLVESGRVALDDPAHMHIDPVLAAANSSSMSSLFGPSAFNVTVRYLLSMRSGLYDFDDDMTRSFQNRHPQVDLSPIDDVWFASTHGHRQPLYVAGTHQDYSSTNFELLGLLLMHHTNITQWDALDQRAAVFSTKAMQQRFPLTKFALHGPCADHTRVHGYQPDDEYGWGLDTAYISCTNGFTCGNLYAPSREVAEFVYALYAEASIVNQTAVDEMTNIWEWYGLGSRPSRHASLG